MSFDDTMLAAFVDGELSLEEVARIEAEARRDPALAARVSRLQALRGGLSAAFDDALNEPPPERLLAAIRGEGAAGANVISLSERRTRRLGQLGPATARWGALAASLVLAFGVGRFWQPPTDELSPIGAGPSGGLVAKGVLATGLERQLASTQGASAPVKIGVSFQAADGRYCRTFILRQARPIAGLACRDRGGWQVNMAMASEASTGVAGGYQTAGDETPAAILETVDQTMRGRPLDAAAEAKARDAGWAAGR